MKNYAEVLAKGSFVVFIMYIIGTLSGYVLRLYLARNLSVADFGLFYAVLAFTSLFVLFRDLGLSTTMVKFIAEYHAKNMQGEVKSVFLNALYIQLIIGTAIMIPIILFSDFIAAAYFKTAAASVPLVILAVTFIISIFFSVQYIFQGTGRIKLYSSVEPLRNILTLVFVILFISFGIAGAASGYLAAAVLSLLVIFRKLLKVFPFFSLKSEVSFQNIKKLGRFSLPVLGFAIAGTLLSYTDTLVLTYFRPLEEVGLYNAALPTSQLLWVFVSSVSIVLLPTASELFSRGEKNALSKIVRIAIKLPFIAIIPLIIVFVSFPEIFLRLFFGEAYVSASIVLQILAINVAFYTLYVISTTVLFGIGKPQTNMKIHGFIAALNLFGNVLLVPTLGIAGAAVSTALSYLVGTILSLFYLEKNVRISIPAASLLKAFAGGAVTLFVFVVSKTLLSVNPWLELIISAVFGLTVYFLFIIFSKTIEKEDIRMLGRINVKLPNALLRVINKLAR